MQTGHYTCKCLPACLQMDIEGWEPRVLAGATRLLASGRVDHLLLEYSPGVVERLQDMALQEELPASILPLVKDGAYALAHLPTFGFAAPWPPKEIDGSEPLPELEEVGAEELAWDIKTLAQRKVSGASQSEGKSTCGTNAELAAAVAQG